MEYSNFLLFTLGLLGVILHNLVNINTINKDPSKGNFSFSSYLKVEWASILISVIVVVIAVIAKTEVKQLQAAGNWVGLGFVAIGFMAQALLVSFMGKAQKIIEK